MKWKILRVEFQSAQRLQNMATQFYKEIIQGDYSNYERKYINLSLTYDVLEAQVGPNESVYKKQIEVISRDMRTLDGLTTTKYHDLMGRALVNLIYHLENGTMPENIAQQRNFTRDLENEVD